jgi:hypothetical protein
MVGGFNIKYNVLLDDGGIMLSSSAIEDLQAALTAHLAHSQLELEAIGRKTVEERYPHMVSQFNYDWFLRSSRNSGTALRHGYAFCNQLQKPPAILWGGRARGRIRSAFVDSNPQGEWITLGGVS